MTVYSARSCRWSAHAADCLIVMLVTTTYSSALTPATTTLSPGPGACGPCMCHDLHVDCSHRQLVTIPRHDLPSRAASMDLSDNRLDHLPARGFARFTNLVYLDLSGNHLHGLHVEAFVGLGSLQQLDLSSNGIPLSATSYPPGVFAPLTASLVHLRLEGNWRSWGHDNRSSDATATYPDTALSHLRRLESLHIDGLPNTTFGRGFHNLTSLQELSMSGLEEGFCAMNVLRNETFVNLPPRLQTLNVSACNISSMEADAFRPLRRLDTLDLSYNVNLGLDKLGDAVYGLQGSALRELHIDFIINPYAICVMVSHWHTRYFANTSLQAIYAQYNRLQVFLDNALPNMPHTLTHVYLTGNQLVFGSYFRDFAKMKNLSYVQNDGLRLAPAPPENYPTVGDGGDLSQGGVRQVPAPFSDRRFLEQCETRRGHQRDDCRHSQTPVEDVVAWSPDLKMVGLQAATPPRLVGDDSFLFVLPPKLEVYESRWNMLYYRLLEINFHPNNSLTTLDLSSNLLTTWWGPITGLPHLTSLNLCNNIAYNVSTQFFRTLTSLISFNASRNNLRHIFQHDLEGELFEPLENLQMLDLSSNYIASIPTNFFRGLISLEALVLSNNQLTSFDVNITHMKNLRLLDLSYNHIHYLPQSVMDHLDVIAANPDVTVQVDLTFNPIACSCKNIAFLTWLEQCRVVFLHEKDFTCLMSDGRLETRRDIFQLIDELQNKCVGTASILVGATTCCFCLLVAIVSAVLYRYRWKLRYLYHASRLAYRRLHLQDETHRFQYDAFVSYASEDNRFVHYEMIDRLEKEKGLRLNIHNRDFIPGRPIASNIVAAVQSSRRTLMVLTRQLLASEWCDYELQMATMEAVQTGRDVLVFLLYEDVRSRELSTQLLYNLQASTFIQYPHHADTAVMQDFWDRLAQALTD